MRFSLTVEEKRGEPKFVNRGGVYTVGCIPIILGRRNSFLSAYGISCRWSPFFSSQRFFLNVLTCRADWILEREKREKLWESSDRLPFSLCTWENLLSACRQTDQPIFNLLSSHPWNASSSAEKSLPFCLFDGVQSNPELFIFCIRKSSPPEG